MLDFKEYFKNPKNILILDGGFSTQLMNHISDRIDGNPLWCSYFLHNNPEAVMKTHLDYLRAGADVIITNTYQASIDGFKKYLQLDEEQAINLIKSAVKQAKDARDIYVKENPDLRFKPLIAGSIGPYGASLQNGSEYNGNYLNHIGLDVIEEWHKSRIEPLIEAGVDLIAVETMPARREAEMLVKFFKNYPEIKVWLCFGCKDEERTNFGENFQEVARKCYDLNPEQVIAIGVNCTNPKYVERLFSGINENRDETIPLIVYPNSGEVYHSKEGWIDKDKCIPLETYVCRWLDLGVKMIGSCCRTYAENTRLIRKEVEKWKNVQ